MTAAPSPATPAWRVLVPAGTAQLVLLGVLGWWPDATYPFPGLVVFLLAFASYLWAARGVLDSEGGTVLIWVFALLMRLTLLPLTPELSDDVYRYLWDGHVQLSGINPYRFAPADPALAGIVTGYHGLINNPTVPTIYPPLAQAAFVLIALVGGAILQAKLLWLGLDLATAWVLGVVARTTGRSRRLTQLLYLWSPLLVVETAWSGHLEPLGLLALALAILLARAPFWSGAATAAAALTKFAPAAAVPALTRRLGRRYAVGFAALVLLLYLPYLGAGRALLTGLGTYARHWRFMEGPFSLLEAVIPGPLAPRWVAAALVLAVVAWTVRRRLDPERAFLWVLGAGLLLTPTLHPWYALWILPVAALRVSRPWILLSGLAFLGYYGVDAYHQSGVWPQPGWLRLCMWAPVVLLLAAEALAAWRRLVLGSEPAPAPSA